MKDPADAAVDAVLPGLLHKVVQAGHRVLVCCPTRQRAEELDTLLWTFHPVSFLPHATTADVMAARQPVLLADEESNLNNADVLLTLDGAMPAADAAYDTVLDVFSAADSAVAAARDRFKNYRTRGVELAYFAHEGGGWQKKL